MAIEIVKNCKILLLDIEGTTTSITFVKDKLFTYAEENVKQFFENKWEEEDVQKIVVSLRNLATKDIEMKIEGAIPIPEENASKEEVIEALVKSVKWQIYIDRKSGPLKMLQGMIWQQGYGKGEIKGHVYDDVSSALEQWHSVEGQKVYIYSSGSVQAQKLLFEHSISGDLSKFIDGYFDTEVGGKQEAFSYLTIVKQIGCKPKDILFLTDIYYEAEAARKVGLNVALVSREGNVPLTPEATSSYPVLHSLAELTPSNKRKQDLQEELPTKMFKTDVKTNSETNAETETSPAVGSTPVVQDTTPVDEPEKMEVEIETTKQDTIADTKMEESAEQNKAEEPIVETVVEEITDPKELIGVSVCVIKPIVEDPEELEEKTEEKQTESVDTDMPESSDSERTEQIVVTEIEEITEKKPCCIRVAELIKDLEPEVANEIEDLQNVGEVLEKECDEILSKVQDVTNLDNIPMKPLLNPIAEETMEAENVDSNDIVERILNTELELEMNSKQCDDIDLNTVSELAEDTKADTVENGIDGVTAMVEEEQVLESAVETTESAETKVVEEKMEHSSTEANKNDTQTVELTSKDTDAATVTNIETGEPTLAESEVEIVKSVPEKIPEPGEETQAAESQLNGKSTNGASVEEVNGGSTENGESNKVEDLNKDEESDKNELNSRLSVDNSKEVVNGANGDSASVPEKSDKESNVEEVPDIKVKTVATDETHIPIEQPTEA